MNAPHPLQLRASRLASNRDARRSIFRSGGMSDQEVFDELNFIAAQLGNEQSWLKDRILDICTDMDDTLEPELWKGYVEPSTLDERVEA